MGRFVAKISAPTGEVPLPICRMILRAIARADVVSLAFPRLQRALVLDMRRGAGNLPTLFVTRQLFSPVQELAAIEERRPGLATIARYERTTWGGSTRAFAEQGILPAILNRLPAEETQGAMAAFEELRDAERVPATRETRPKVRLEPPTADQGTLTPDHGNG